MADSFTEAAVLDRRRPRASIRKAASLWARPYARYLFALTFLYVVGYGTLLSATDGLPYVMDNNESFSTLLHATNLYRFGLSKSLGLTDEATGPDPAAHPYVHTHQGNFPRVFGLLIYALGARTIESQIVVTTFTVGIVVVFLAFHVLARLAGPLLAFVAGLALLSDYIHVMQWQVNTYRIWHFFLLFSSLACAYGIGGSRWRWWLALTAVNALVLFYCELVSVAFTSILTGLFVISLHWCTPRTVIAWTVAHTAGGLAALAILIVQLVAYLGWDDFVLDVWLTFSARNYGPGDETFSRMVSDFYQRNNILFWANFVDGSRLKSLSAMLDLHVRYVFQVYTPILSLIVLVLAAGWLLGLSWGYGSIWRIARNRPEDGWRLTLRYRNKPVSVRGSLDLGIQGFAPRLPRWLHGVMLPLRAVLLVGPLTVALFSVVNDESFMGITPAPATQSGVLLNGAFALAGALGVALLLTKMMTGSWVALGRLPLARLCAVAVLLIGISSIIGKQPTAYDQQYRAIWYDPIAAIIPLWVERIALLLALGLAVSMCLFGTRRVLGTTWTARLRGLVCYIVCAGIAYSIAYTLATGYVASGYVHRSAPLAVFVFGVIVAFAVCIVVAAAARGWKAAARHAVAPHPVMVWEPRVLGVVATLLLVWMAGYWIVLNQAYVTLFPPNTLAFIKRFAEAPLHGSSAVVNNYGVPVGVEANSWTYYTEDFGIRPTVRQTPNGYVSDSNPIPHLWLADKQVNPAYWRPDYFVCMRPRNFDSYAIRATPPRDFNRNDCAEWPIVERIERKRQRIVEHQLVARDPRSPASWAIVKLDWDVPPHLLSIESGRQDEVVRLVVTPTPQNIGVQVQYRYAQTDGILEQQTTVRIHAAGADGRWCVIERSANRASFTLPAEFRGTIRASVTPRSETKTGPETFGDQLVLGDGQGTPCAGR